MAGQISELRSMLYTLTENVSKLATGMAVTGEQVHQLAESVKAMTPKSEFVVVRTVVFGLVGLILAGTMTTILIRSGFAMMLGAR